MALDAEEVGIGEATAAQTPQAPRAPRPDISITQENLLNQVKEWQALPPDERVKFRNIAAWAASKQEVPRPGDFYDSLDAAAIGRLLVEAVESGENRVVAVSADKKGISVLRDQLGALTKDGKLQGIAVGTVRELESKYYKFQNLTPDERKREDPKGVQAKSYDISIQRGTLNPQQVAATMTQDQGALAEIYGFAKSKGIKIQGVEPAIGSDSDKQNMITADRIQKLAKDRGVVVAVLPKHVTENTQPDAVVSRLISAYPHAVMDYSREGINANKALQAPKKP